MCRKWYSALLCQIIFFILRTHFTWPFKFPESTDSSGVTPYVFWFNTRKLIPSIAWSSVFNWSCDGGWGRRLANLTEMLSHFGEWLPTTGSTVILHQTLAWSRGGSSGTKRRISAFPFSVLPSFRCFILVFYFLFCLSCSWPVSYYVPSDVELYQRNPEITLSCQILYSCIILL